MSKKNLFSKLLDCIFRLKIIAKFYTILNFCFLSRRYYCALLPGKDAHQFFREN
jgi:hypothetical protein